MRVWRRHARAVVAGAVLQDVAVDRVRLHLHVALRDRALTTLETVRVAVSIVQVATHSKVGVTKSEVGHGGLVVASTEARTIKLFPLELVLDPLAVGCVADQREDRSDAFDQERPLRGLSIVQGSLESTVRRVRYRDLCQLTCTQ